MPPGERALRDLPAPAKLNLFLHVTGRRADGYHLLETVFELIDLADRIDLERLDHDAIELATPLPGVPAHDDLTVRAARALAQATGCRLGVRITLDKRIPLGGGLGGGSSDAATVLMGLNRLWSLGLSRVRLQRIGLALGADVPFFVYGRTAYATGVGDTLRPIDLPARRYLVVAPPVQVSTAEVYAAPDLTRHTEPLKIDGLSRGRSVFRGRNDLQPVVLARYPAVAAALAALQRIAETAGLDPALARMSGSGACVFLPLDADGPDDPGVRLREQLSRMVDGQVLLVRSLPRHPLSS